MKYLAALTALLISLPLQAAERSVFVQLFEWRWEDVALECEQVLGPAGFSAVQVSPPNEHVDHRSPKLYRQYAWWARYQPVTFDLVSRSGDEAAFRDMVQRCDAVGVGIYVDAVLNHMGDQVGVGVAGTPFDIDKREFRDYSDKHFNRKCFIQPEDYQASDDPVLNRQRADRVRRCQLLDLPDLNTGHPHVQDTTVEYLQRLVDMGVAGFRIDAAKHVFPEHIASMLDRVEGEPFVFQEVVDTRGEPIGVFDYIDVANVTEFLYSKRIGEAFAAGRVADLKDLDEPGGLMPGDRAVVFVDNHDNQRGHGMAAQTTHRSGKVYDLANVFMLAWPYGYPKLMSSYEWGGEDDNRGPPHDGDGNTLAVYGRDGASDCGGDNWVCEHRRPAMLAMVDFRNRARAAGATSVAHWWDNDGDQVAFAVGGDGGGVGFVALNSSAGSSLHMMLDTGLAAGEYRNLLDPESTVTVDAQGRASVRLAPLQALAITREHREQAPDQ